MFDHNDYLMFLMHHKGTKKQRNNFMANLFNLYSTRTKNCALVSSWLSSSKSNPPALSSRKAVAQN